MILTYFKILDFAFEFTNSYASNLLLILTLPHLIKEDENGNFTPLPTHDKLLEFPEQLYPKGLCKHIAQSLSGVDGQDLN